MNHLLERRVQQFEAEGGVHRIAIDNGETRISYGELNAAADRLALRLSNWGIGPGDHVGLLFDKGPETYVALFAVLKAGAAFVPFDASFPTERIRFIAADAAVKCILSMSVFADKLNGLPVPVRHLDDEATGTSQEVCPVRRQEDPDPDPLAYVIYTSGTTGQPKGVAVAHSSICNFVRVAGETYGYRGDDRVYQGLTIAFDFSFEEIFVPLFVGATLTPSRPGMNLVGEDLRDFLLERGVTALCCVPTVLATIEQDIPALRLLLLSGEACPPDLVKRWHSTGRILLNAYGPTETTVTSSLARLSPDRKVTIGAPLPTYTMLILDEAEVVEKLPGEVGEIAIAGICLARGYLNRPDLTASKFVPDTLGLPNNPGRRIYRSGDLGRITDNGEIEYLGRIDTQVKIRGYRIELGEIESALMEWPGVAQAVVNPWSPEPGVSELVAYVTLRPDAAPLDRPALAARLAERLPRYMMPGFIEVLQTIPLSVAQKADRRALPAPSGPRLSLTDKAATAPSNDDERVLEKALADVLGLEAVSTEAHFFDELGAHSLLMARFCAAVRRARPDLSPSMRDVYAHPAIVQLARVLGERRSQADDPASPASRRSRRYREPSAVQFWTCGALQGLYYIALSSLQFALSAGAFGWIYQAQSLEDFYFRTVASVIAVASFLILLPIAAKWTLIGRVRAEDIEIWSLRYFRFWVVKHLVQHSPAALLKGTILFNLYLNALGARIALTAHVNSETIPAAPDLLTVGAESVLQQHSLCPGYKAEGNFLRIRPVTIGAGVNIGVAGLVDIDTVIEDGVHLAPSSCAEEGQTLKAGCRYHGVPAVPCEASYALDEAMICTLSRRFAYAAGQVVFSAFILAPALLAVPYLIFAAHGVRWAETSFDWTMFVASPIAYSELLLLASALNVAVFLIAGLALAAALPRLAMLVVRPGRTYPLFGPAYGVVGFIRTITNIPTYSTIFGDSSFMVHYLRWLGYRLNKVEQSGSNFGIVQRHDMPTLCNVGSGSMISDGVFLSNVRMSGTAFRVDETRIGERNYFGNNLIFPSGARTGSNCLLATKMLPPVDGPRRQDTGLLGSPCFEIPRINSRDAAQSEALGQDAKQRGLARKNRVNVVTIALFLVLGWVFLTLTLGAYYVAYDFFRRGEPWWIAVILAEFLFTFAYFILIERASLGFRRIKPVVCSIYDTPFLAVERYWKLTTSPLEGAGRGTPFRNVINRAGGAVVGRRVFDDGCRITERTLTRIGDFATLSEGATLQSHSLEEGVFKADHLEVGRGCSIGPNALVHYGVRMGDRVVVEADAFVMKGEAPEADAIWQGNPARPLARRTSLPDGAFAFDDAVIAVRELAASPSREAAHALSPAERGRAGRFIRGADRRRYIRAHAQFRAVLAEYTGENAAHLDIRYVGDRPTLPTRPDLHLSLACSRDRIAIAIAPRPCGIDIEFIDGLAANLAVAETHFHPREQAAWSALSPDRQQHGFYEIWTRKEATAKALGLGVALDFEGFSVEANGEQAGFGESPLSPGARSSVRSWSFEPRLGYQVSLALVGPPLGAEARATGG